MTPTTDFLAHIVHSLVTHTEDIHITERQDELGTLVTLQVHPDDIRFIIWRSGKTIDSLRTLLRIFGAKMDSRINLRLLEKPLS